MILYAYHNYLNRSSENKQFTISAPCFTSQRLMYKVLGQTLQHENIITPEFLLFTNFIKTFSSSWCDKRQLIMFQNQYVTHNVCNELLNNSSHLR